MIERPRIYLIGSCEGFDGLRESLANHNDLDVVGWAETVSEAASALAGGHLEVVLHATRQSSLPARRARRDPRAHAGADVLVASGESSRAARARRSTPTSPTSCCCRS